MQKLSISTYRVESFIFSNVLRVASHGMRYKSVHTYNETCGRMRCCRSAIYTVMMRGLEIVVQRYHLGPAMVQHDVGQHHFILRYGRDDDTRDESGSYMKLPSPALYCPFRLELNTKRLIKTHYNTTRQKTSCRREDILAQRPRLVLMMRRLRRCTTSCTRPRWKSKRCTEKMRCVRMMLDQVRGENKNSSRRWARLKRR